MLDLPIHLHPMVVHFPIALFIVALVFEIISMLSKNKTFHKSAIYMFVTATLVTPFVVQTGIWEVEKLGLNHPILDKHSQYALWLMWSTLISLPVLWFLNQRFKKYFRVLFIIFLISSAILVSLTGDKGGIMVYEYGVGIED